jgi:hypothetical protein
MPFFNIVPLKALFVAYDKFVRPRCIEHMSLLHQPLDGSMFDMFITNEMYFFKAGNG